MSLNSIYNLSNKNDNDNIIITNSDLSMLYNHNNLNNITGDNNTNNNYLSNIYNLQSNNHKVEDYFASYNKNDIKKEKKSKYVYPNYSKK